MVDTEMIGGFWSGNPLKTSSWKIVITNVVFQLNSKNKEPGAISVLPSWFKTNKKNPNHSENQNFYFWCTFLRKTYIYYNTYIFKILLVDGCFWTYTLGFFLLYKAAGVGEADGNHSRWLSGCWLNTTHLGNAILSSPDFWHINTCLESWLLQRHGRYCSLWSAGSSNDDGKLLCGLHLCQGAKEGSCYNVSLILQENLE